MTLLQYWEQKRPKKYQTRPVDKLRCAVIQQCYENGWNLIDEEEPRIGKSEQNCVYGPAHNRLTRPNFRDIFICHSQDLVNKFVKANATLAKEDGFTLSAEKQNSFKIDGSQSLDDTCQGFGIKGAVSGRGANRITLDDVLKSGTEAMSEKVRTGIITDIISTNINRLEPHNGVPGAITILNARLHQGDPTGWFLDESGLPYVRLHFPATNDDGQRAFIENTYDGTKKLIGPYASLIPGNRPRLDELQRALTPYFWASQYMQEPALGVDAYFDVSRCPIYKYPHCDCWWLAVDAAQTATSGGSQSAFVALGYSRQDGGLKVLGVSAGRWRQDVMGDQLMSFIEAMRRLTGMRELTCIVERAAAGFGLIDRYSHLIHIDPIQPIASKESRAGEVCFLVNRGSVQLPESAPWLESFKTELTGFPLAPLADKVDALVHALKFVISQNEFKPVESESLTIIDALDMSQGGYSAAFNQNWGGSGSAWDSPREQYAPLSPATQRAVDRWLTNGSDE
jgi:predicted phage terminase large subunit-like protein